MCFLMVFYVGKVLFPVALVLGVALATAAGDMMANVWICFDWLNSITLVIFASK